MWRRKLYVRNDECNFLDTLARQVSLYTKTKLLLKDLIRNGANKLIEAKSCKNQLILSNEKKLKMELINDILLNRIEHRLSY